MNKSTNSNKTPFQWRPFLALIGVIFISVMNWEWAWGILFLFWVVPDIFSGVTYFVEPVERNNNPFLFWAIISTWILLSLYLLSTLFVNYSNYGY